MDTVAHYWIDLGDSAARTACAARRGWGKGQAAASPSLKLPNLK